MFFGLSDMPASQKKGEEEKDLKQTRNIVFE